MANEKNLIPQAHILTVEEQSAGGKKSAEVRREKKTIQKILADLLDTNVGDIPQMAKSLQKLGIEGDKPLKDVFTLVATLNTLKTANLSDLGQLSKLLGEDKQNENADVLTKLDKVIGEVDKLAE